MQDLNDMLYFAEVVKHGSFAAAGRALGLPKSRLSRRVAKLETDLGVRLLQRTTRKLSLTTAGELYYRHCNAMCDEAEAAAAAVAQVQSEPRGVIRVVCPVTLAQSVVGPVLSDYLLKHPLVQVQMQVSNRVVDLVEEGVDVALRVRLSVDDSGSLVVKRLGQTQSLLVASPALIQRQGCPADPSDLSLMDSVAMSVTDGRAFWKLSGPNGAQYTVTHRPVFVADDLLTLKFAILDGVGLGLLPDYMCRDEMETGQLVSVLPNWALEPGIVHAVFGSRRGLIPAVRSFLDFLGEHVTHEPNKP
ncbi:LysR substrate-binding domain-containing protein [Pusillimonas sp. SM2304]|uniref:LysR substrate-binding domain-containing protein n=1 Tax=Pusillimonas sp. SM2304 TaxID=3073241 RepID=UPI00287528A9|nr:LysR substrate-binding domain-containing protein [Pusillimonas sp. SM2304]MDS1141986.1 LysR substrate-binding domain-containing protein [Pusillimonas sp. SM2304]